MKPSKFQRLKGAFKPMTPERIELVADLMAKLVGETVQSKVLRAVLMGAIAAGSQLAQTDSPNEPIATTSSTTPINKSNGN